MLSQNDLVIEYAFIYYWQNDIRTSVYQKIFSNLLWVENAHFLFFLSPPCLRLSLHLTDRSWVLRFPSLRFPLRHHAGPAGKACFSSAQNPQEAVGHFFSWYTTKNAVSCGNWVYTQMAVAERASAGEENGFSFRLVKGFGDSFKVSVLAHQQNYCNLVLKLYRLSFVLFLWTDLEWLSNISRWFWLVGTTTKGWVK